MAYTQSYGPKIIEIGFKNMYPESGNLLLHFETFIKNIAPIMELKLHNSRKIFLLVSFYKKTCKV